MGIHIDLCYYDPVEEDWHIYLDLTKLWSTDNVIPGWPYDNDKGDPVFPKCCENGDRLPASEGYEICIEVGDSEGKQAGDNSFPACEECYDADFYGMHLLEPNEYEPICTTEGCQVDVNWNFHADCEPTEDFLIEIYNPDVPGFEGWASVPNVYTVSGDINISDCVLGVATVTLLSTVPDGVYNVRITSQCLDQGQCLKRVEEIGAVIIDTIDPVVVVEENLDGNYKDSDIFDLNWTMEDNTGVTYVTIETSLDCGQTWEVLFANEVEDGFIDDPRIDWDGGIEYGTTIHVGDTDIEPPYGDFNWDPDDNESCHMAHVRVTAEDCGANSASDETGEPGVGFTIDNTPPTVSDLKVEVETPSSFCQDDCLVGGKDANILFDYSDNCGPLTAKIEYKDECGDNQWKTIVDDLVLPGINGDDYAYPWLVPPTLQCCIPDGGLDFRVTVTDCPGNEAVDTYETCVEAPLILVDCITGWCGEWQHAKWLPRNCNARDTIMVVFNKPLDLATVSISDFQVVGKTITGIDVYKDPDISGDNGGIWQGYTYVYLTVTPLMATDAKPTVKLVGCVSAEDPNVEPLCGDVEPIECIAQDGIAPILTVTASPENPGHNEEVTVTVTASECLNEAYLMIGKGSPNDYNFNWCKPIGWPTDWWTQGWDKRVPNMPPLPEGCPLGPYPEWGTIPMDEQGNELRACIWENWYDFDCCQDAHGCDWNWFAMDAEVDQACDRDMNMDTWDGSKTWTYTFYNRYGANFDWFVEVAGHDYSHWLPTYPWKHEKWTQESYLFWSGESDYIELCEGWNLVSVPWNLVDPTPAGAFGIAGHVGYSGITKAYYYTGGAYGTWQYTALNPVTGAWTGTLTSIVPGKAYWVWVSPPWMDWMIRMVEPDPMSVPPTQTVKKGWNMLGLTVMHDADWHSYTPSIKSYLIGLRDLGPTHLYFYDACEPEWIRLHSGGETYWSWGDNDWPWGWGAWFWANADDSFGP
jgi:hypothetical protein